MFLTIDDESLDKIAHRIAERQGGMPTRRLLNVQQTAEYLGLSTNAVRALRRKAKLRPVRSFGRILFDLQDLDRMIQHGKDAAS